MSVLRRSLTVDSYIGKPYVFIRNASHLHPYGDATMPTPYEQGYSQAMQALGTTKTASYFQNVVGFDDPSQLKALRDAGAQYDEDPEASRNYYADSVARSRARHQEIHPRLGNEPAMRVEDTSFLGKLLGRKVRNPAWKEWQDRREALNAAYTAANPHEENLDVRGRAKLMEGTPYGHMGKYTEFPGMYAYGEGAGYLSKEDLLKSLRTLMGDAGQLNDARVADIENSPHQYFTSTEAG